MLDIESSHAASKRPGNVSFAIRWRLRPHFWQKLRSQPLIGRAACGASGVVMS